MRGDLRLPRNAAMLAAAVGLGCLSSLGMAAPQRSSAQAPAAGSQLDDTKRAVARELGRKAIANYRDGDYTSALDHISRAHALVGLTTTGLWRARCLVQLGRLVDAKAQLQAVLAIDLGAAPKALHQRAAEEAQTELTALEPRIPRLRLDWAGDPPAGTIITLDGQTLDAAAQKQDVPLDPGEHRIEISGEARTASATLSARIGQVISLPIRLLDRGPQLGAAQLTATRGNQGGDELPPLARTGTSPQWIVGWTVAGLGAASALAGAVTGGLAYDARASLENDCPQRRCAPMLHDDVDRYDRLRVASTATLVAGGALGGVGAILLLTAPAGAIDPGLLYHRPPQLPPLRVTVGAGNVRLEGRF